MRLFTTALSISAIVSSGLLVSADKYPNVFGAGCVLVKTSIYCYGGSETPTDYNFVGATNHFYSLDVSNTVSRQDNDSSWKPLWTDNSTAPTQNMLFGMAAFADSDTFIVSGGTGVAMRNASLPQQTLSYNTTSNTWTPINTSLFWQMKLNVMVANVQSGNQMYMWGGVSDLSTGYTTVDNPAKKNYPLRARILSYNESGWTWSYGKDGNRGNVPILGRERHTIAQAGDGRFYIFGGQTATPNPNNASQLWPYEMTDADMQSILVFDMNQGWSVMQTNGNIPSTRWHASSVTLGDGTILLYGGAKPGFQQDPNNQQQQYLDPVEDVAYVLNPVTGSWTNVTPQITTSASGNRNSQQFQRFGHSLVRVSDDHVFILFGRTNNIQNADGFLILDTSTWTLTDSFSGVKSPGDAQDTEGRGKGGDDGLSGGAIAGTVIGVLVGVGLIAGIFAFIFIRRRRNTLERNTPEQKQGIIDDTDHPPYSPTVVDTMSPISSVAYGSDTKLKPDSVDAPRLILQPVKPDGA